MYCTSGHIIISLFGSGRHRRLTARKSCLPRYLCLCFVRVRLIFSTTDGEETDDRRAAMHDDDIRKAAVFGALDGVLTSFAIVAGAAGEKQKMARRVGQGARLLSVV